MNTFLASLSHRLTSFRSDCGGNISVIFGVALLPLILLVGAAIDYSYANMAKAKLSAAADAAALVAVNKIAMAMSSNDAETTAKDFFNVDAAGIKNVTLTDVSAKVTDTSSGRSAVISYTATVPTTFMGIAGFKTLALKGSTTAASALPTYIDFYLLLDNTPSMGVGATMTDINTLVANTKDQCAFACHDLSATPNDYYGLAKKLGVQMRIDVVRQATQKLMDTAGTTQTTPGQFGMAIYTFGESAEHTKLSQIQKLTWTLSEAKNAASAIDLMTIPYQNYRSDTQTDFHDIMEDMDKEITAAGDGVTKSSPQKILFFVSDGVADRAVGSPACLKPTTNGSDAKTGQKFVRCQEPLDVALCKKLTDRGVKIAVLYTTYLPLPTNGWYNKWIAPFSSEIAKNMEACATPGLYFEVSPTEGISDAMTALFQKAVLQARLTK
jgi:Flp pilus assembly protein TadG